MIVTISILCTLACFGALVYFRYTDTRSVTVNELKNYLNKAERHIEKMLQQKEKFFEDRMIGSEVMLDRMKVLSQALEQKLSNYNEIVEDGDHLHQTLSEQFNNIQSDLNEYRDIHESLSNMEEKIYDITELKNKIEKSETNLNILQQTIKEFSSEFQQTTKTLKKEGRQDLETFVRTMQNDLTTYLNQSRIELDKRESDLQNIMNQIDENNHKLKQDMSDFQYHTQQGIEALKDSYQEDLNVAQSTVDTQMTGLYDTISNLKENVYQGTENIEGMLKDQKAYFDYRQELLEETIREFRQNLADSENEAVGELAQTFKDQTEKFDRKIQHMTKELEQNSEVFLQQQEELVKKYLQQFHDSQSRIQEAFMAQEEEQREKNLVLQNHFNEIVKVTENRFEEEMYTWSQRVDSYRQLAENILDESRDLLQEKMNGVDLVFHEKVEEISQKFEASFEEKNHIHIQNTINTVTDKLEEEFRTKYENRAQEVISKISVLESSAKDVDERYNQIICDFNEQKNQLDHMTSELKQDQEDTAQTIVNKVQKHLEHVKEEVLANVQIFIEIKKQEFDQDKVEWQENYKEIVNHAEIQVNKIFEECKNIKMRLDGIVEEILANTQQNIDQLETDSQLRMEYFKNNISEIIISGQDKIYQQQEKSQIDIKRLYDEFQEKEQMLIQSVEKNSEHLDQQIEGFKQIVSEIIISGRDDVYQQQERTHANIKQLYLDLQEKEQQLVQNVERNCNRLDEQIEETGKRIEEFNKKSERFNEIKDLLVEMDHSSNNIKELKSTMDAIENSLKNSTRDGQQILGLMQETKENVDQKVKIFENLSDHIERTSAELRHHVHEAQTANEIYESFNAERERIWAIGEMLDQNLSRYNDLEMALGDLQGKKETVNDILSQVEGSYEAIHTLNTSSSALADQMDSMRKVVDEIGEQIIDAQSEMSKYHSEKNELFRAIQAIDNLEYIIKHAEDERSAINHSLNILQKEAGRVSPSSGSKGSASMVSDEQVATIIRLSQSGWSKEQIANQLHLKPSLVELVLQRHKSQGI